MFETVTLTKFDYRLLYYVTIHNRDCIPISFVTLHMLETETSKILQPVMNVTLATRLLRLQQSLHGGGNQHGSNLNVRLEYIWVKKMTGGKAKDPLAKPNFTARHDRNIYNKWYQYNEQNFCCSSTELQPNLQVSAGAETLNMDHSPRIEAEDVDDDNDDSDEDNDDKLYKKDLENAVYGTPPTAENQSPLPDGLNGVFEEIVKCVLVMEAWCPQMLQAFDNDGDQYSTQHHNHTKHDFPVMPYDDMWPVDAEGKPIDANPDHIYKFTNMKQK